MFAPRFSNREADANRKSMGPDPQFVWSFAPFRFFLVHQRTFDRVCSVVQGTHHVVDPNDPTWFWDQCRAASISSHTT